MRIHKHALFPRFGHAAIALILAAPLPAAVVTPYTEALENPIVSAFIPPTRSDDPYAATASAVHQWDAEAQAWTQVYTPPWSTSEILHISGYEKSSQVLYVVHTGGIGRTGDGGKTWIEAVPPGFAGEGTFRMLVNPEERSQAVLSSGTQLWQTFDYGESWMPLDFAGKGRPVIGLGFIASDSGIPRFLVAHPDSVRILEGTPLKAVSTWHTEIPLARSILHPERSVAFLADADGQWYALALPAGSGPQGLQPLASTTVGKPAIALDSGSSSVWSTEGSVLKLTSLADADVPVFSVAKLPETPTDLLYHPRDQNALYVVGTTRIHLVDDVFQGASSAFIAPMDWRNAVAVAWESTLPSVPSSARPGPQPPQEEAMDVAILLNTLLAGEPSFTQTVRKALDNEQFSPGSFLEWQTKARKRNWLPELRLEGGMREFPVDDNKIVTSLDRFGFEEMEDFRLPDRLRNLSYFRIILEWQLDQIVYDEEQVDVSRERRQAFRDRRAMIEDLSELYYQRIQRIIEAKGYLGKPSKARQMITLLEIHQLSEVLNGYCGEALFEPFPIQ